MSRRVAAVGLLVVIVGLVVVPIAATIGGATSAPPPSQERTEGTNHLADRVESAEGQSALFQRTTGDFDRTLFSIRAFENGSARWTFRYTRLLENETEESNFEGFAADFRTNETVLYREFREQAEALTRSGSNVTGRPMNATAFDRDARVRPLGNTGIVEMSFTWTNFGQQRDGGGVRISDVFEGGIYIRSDQRLRFVAGPGLAFETVDPTPTNTSVSSLSDSEWVAWTGERSFADRQPAVSFQPASAVRTEPEGDGATVSTDATDAGSDGTGGAETDQTTTAAGDTSTGIGMLVTVTALALVALGVVVAAWVNGYLEPGEDGSVAADESDSGDGSAGTVGTDASEEMETAMLSDEDRVRQLLEDNGGRMKQTEIVDGTEWSKSKVSMLLSDMEEEGEITKLRVGRQNIISLPGAEPEAARSPFEDLDDGGP